MYTGKIITFFEHRDIVCGICLEEKGIRIHVLHEDGREIMLSKNRIIHTSLDCVDMMASRAKQLSRIRQSIQHQKSLMKHVCAMEMWEALDGHGRLFDLRTLAVTVFGDTVESDHEVAVLRALMQERLHFKLQGNRFQANTPEQIAKLKINIEKEIQRQQTIDEGVEWLRSVTKGKEIICPHRDKFIEMLKNFGIFGKEAPQYSLTKQILNKVGISDQQACFSILVKLGVWDEDENLLLQRYQIPHTWPDSVSKQVENLEKCGLSKAPDDPYRKDLTHLKAFSIDEPFTIDIDDAISFEFYEDFLQLGIHITDAASFILTDTPLDKEAARRGATLYLPEGKIPMLPSTLSENILSLREGERKLAISMFAKLSLTGELLDFTWVLSVIKIAAKLSYDKADDRIEKDTDFSRLYNLLCLLREQRKLSGATWVLIPELQVRIEKNKEIFFKLRDKETPSQVLVSECMILANYCAALLFKKKQFPALYRKQAEPIKKLTSDISPSLFQLFSQGRNFSRVEVDVTPGPHSSLGLSSYTSITSPLRKYLDLVTQRQLVYLLKSRIPAYSPKALKNIAASVQPFLTRAAIVEQERKRYWVLKVLKGRIGEKLPALILDKRFRVYTILLIEYLLDVHLKAPEGIFLSPGDMVSVIIEHVNLFGGTLQVRLTG